jgi:hypothetical protein
LPANTVVLGATDARVAFVFRTRPDDRRVRAHLLAGADTGANAPAHADRRADVLELASAERAVGADPFGSTRGLREGKGGVS